MLLLDRLERGFQKYAESHIAHAVSLDSLPPDQTSLSIADRRVGCSLPRALKKLTLVGVPVDAALVSAVRELKTLDSIWLQSCVGSLGSLFDALATLPSLMSVSILTEGVHIESEIWRLRTARALRSLRIHPTQSPAWLVGFSQLRSLALHAVATVDASFVEALASLPLETLSLSGAKAIEVSALTRIAAMHSLRGLSLGFESVDDTEMTSIVEAMPQLDELAFSGTRVKGRCFDAIARLPALRALTVGSGSTNFTNLNALAALSTLEALCLSNVKPASAVMSAIVANNRLRGLWASYGINVGPWLGSLVARGSLEVLDLTNSNVSDKHLATLATSSTLRSLAIGQCSKITDKGVAALGSTVALEDLELGHQTDVGDRAFEGLARAPSLQVIEAPNLKSLGDAGVRALAACRSLRRVMLSGTRCSFQSLDALAQLPTMDTLGVWGCECVTHESVATWRQSRPSLTVYADEELYGRHRLMARNSEPVVPLVSGPLMPDVPSREETTVYRLCVGVAFVSEDLASAAHHADHGPATFVSVRTANGDVRGIAKPWTVLELHACDVRLVFRGTHLYRDRCTLSEDGKHLALVTFASGDSPIAHVYDVDALVAFAKAYAPQQR
jgi:hypothetical protein